MTPENTLEPESMPATEQSKGNKSAKYFKRLSIIGKEAKELSKSAGKVHLTK